MKCVKGKYSAKKGKRGKGEEPVGIQGSEGEGEPFTRNGRMLNFRSFRRLFFLRGEGAVTAFNIMYSRYFG